jgi:hypothetical protein
MILALSPNETVSFCGLGSSTNVDRNVVIFEMRPELGGLEGEL